MILWALFGLAGLCKLGNYLMDRAEKQSDVAGIDDDITANYDADGNNI